MKLLDLYRELEQTTSTGCWKYTIETETLIWSEQIFIIHGIDSSEPITVEKAISFYHPEDEEIITEAFGLCISEHKESRIDLRIINSKNELNIVKNDPYLESYRSKIVNRMNKISSLEISSSCSPSIAFVDGVRIGSGNLSFSFIPSGMATPHIVLFPSLYSLQACPDKYPLMTISTLNGSAK
jgi:hypothetical protein